MDKQPLDATNIKEGESHQTTNLLDMKLPCVLLLASGIAISSVSAGLWDNFMRFNLKNLLETDINTDVRNEANVRNNVQIQNEFTSQSNTDVVGNMDSQNKIGGLHGVYEGEVKDNKLIATTSNNRLIHDGVNVMLPRHSRIENVISIGGGGGGGNSMQRSNQFLTPVSSASYAQDSSSRRPRLEDERPSTSALTARKPRSMIKSR
jgi:hypothetical protein